MAHHYWRDGHIEVRYKKADGRWGSKARNPVTQQYWASTDEADTWAEHRELLERHGLTDDATRPPQPEPEITVAEWFAQWWPHQDLSLRSDGNYRYIFEAFVLPEWGHRPLSEITALEVQAWEQQLQQAYKRGGVPTSARTRLSTLLGDAVIAGLIDTNPALRQKRRGRKSGVGTGGRGEEKVWATPLQALLFAERTAVISGRDDDFIFNITMAYCGLRWGEAAGLRPAYVFEHEIRVDRQLVEVGGKFYPLPPKDDSHRTVHTPPFLGKLLQRQLRSVDGVRCTCKPSKPTGPRPELPCQGDRYLFLGSRVLEDVHRVRRAAHPRNSNYARDMFDPATEGWWPEQRQTHRPKRPRRPVMVNLGPGQIWPGEVWRPAWPAAEKGKPFVWKWGPGQRVWSIADDEKRFAVASWLPVVPGLTPHGLRHSLSTWMEDLGIGEALRDERMGHAAAGKKKRSMRALYTHVSDVAVQKLLAGLQEIWEASLAQRASISPHSPVAVLDELLAPYRDKLTAPAPASQRQAKVVRWPGRSERPPRRLTIVS